MATITRLACLVCVSAFAALLLGRQLPARGDGCQYLQSANVPCPNTTPSYCNQLGDCENRIWTTVYSNFFACQINNGQLNNGNTNCVTLFDNQNNPVEATCYKNYQCMLQTGTNNCVQNPAACILTTVQYMLTTANCP